MMTDISTDDIQVWFLRHGKTSFNPENSSYNNFMDKLCNGYDEPLLKEHGINFKTLPDRVEYVAFSPAIRAVDTAEVLRKKLDVKHMEEMPSLHEVIFDKEIVLEHEFKSLKQIRPKILRRWYNNENKAESFKDSLTRVKEIESFLSERPGKSIILVTHGWFLRLLEIHFVQGKQTDDITLKDILEVKPVPLGHCKKATVARKCRVELPQMDTVEATF